MHLHGQWTHYHVMSVSKLDAMHELSDGPGQLCAGTGKQEERWKGKTDSTRVVSSEISGGKFPEIYSNLSGNLLNMSFTL